MEAKAMTTYSFSNSFTDAKPITFDRIKQAANQLANLAAAVRPVRIHASPSLVERLREFPLSAIVCKKIWPSDFRFDRLPTIEEFALDGNSYLIEYSDGSFEFHHDD